MALVAATSRCCLLVLLLLGVAEGFSSTKSSIIRHPATRNHARPVLMTLESDYERLFQKLVTSQEAATNVGLDLSKMFNVPTPSFGGAELGQLVDQLIATVTKAFTGPGEGVATAAAAGAGAGGPRFEALFAQLQQLAGALALPVDTPAAVAGKLALLDKALGPPARELAAALPLPPGALDAVLAKVAADPGAAYPQLALVLALAAAAPLALVAAGGAARDRLPLPEAYDPRLLAAYYQVRPVALYSRVAEVVAAVLENYVPIYLDGLTGNAERNRPRRAEKVKETIARLGASYIKVGQACSIRPDLFDEAYLLELQKLQDQVPPFSSEEARAILREQLGRDPAEVFADMRAFEAPLAAASLGQVYKAALKDGTPVAVKVQRPDMLPSVTLDLYVIRSLLLAGASGPVVAARETCRSLCAVIDAWAVRFLEELDYEREAANAKDFAARMAKCPAVRDVTLTPRVFDELTTRFVLVSEWVEGERLSSIDVTTERGKKQVLTVVNILLNSYLTQLLETGLLHADPHPGNFLLTPDGRLCVLDYGLMTEVEEDRRLALIEYITHLNARDWEASLTDLTVLGFIPKEIDADPAKRAIVVPLLGTVLEQLNNGGGAKAVTVDTVGTEIEALSKEYPIVIPAYFGLIVRAFSSLEGIALSADPNFSIVQACFPYLSRRLLTDDSPRMRAMLRTWLYGRGEYLDVARVDEILEGYREFTALTAEASKVADGRRAGDFVFDEKPASLAARLRGGEELFDAPTLEALQLLFSKDGNYVQDLVVEELVRVTDALTRDAAVTLVATLRALAERRAPPAPRFPLPRPPLPAGLPRLPGLPGRGRRGPEGEAGAAAPAAAALALGVAPLRLPRGPLLRATERLGSVVRLSSEDEQTLATVERLVGLLRKGASREGAGAAGPALGIAGGLGVAGAAGGRRGQGAGAEDQLSPREVVQLVQAVAPLLQSLQPGVRAIAEKYVRKLAARVLSRLADDIENGAVSAIRRL